MRWLLVHPGFHLDEALAVYLLRCFGEKFFSGVADAKIIFKLRDVEGISPEQMQWGAEQLLRELGVLCIGCLGDRGARFDEHGTKRDGGKAACMLVAEYLDVVKHHDVRDMLAFVDQFDRQGHAAERTALKKARGHTSALLVEYDLRAVMRAKHRNGETNDAVMEFVLGAIETLILRKQRMRELRAYLRKPKNRQVRSVECGDQKVSVWLVHTNEHDAPSVAFHDGAHVIIVRRESGHTVIISQGKRFNMVPLLVALRTKEAALQGWSMQEGDTLDGEHSSSVPNWTFNPPTGNIFNTAEQKVIDVAPTALSDIELLDLVEEHLVFV